ncbi:MAG: TAT-variant-translocated molybdopterin oxidoreductase [Verrucomicrobiota bacterium]
MKRVWQHPETETDGKASAGPINGDRVYWRSYGELEDTPEFREWLEREFPRGAAEMQGEEADEVTRRSFLKYMGASTALAGFGMAGCRRPTLFLVPYARSVEWVIPGKPTLYATAMPRVKGCMPLVATTHEGRPTKLEGNPLHPNSNGGTDVYAQASIIGLYDPDRSKRVLREGKVSTTAEFDAFLQEAQLLPKIEKGKGLAFLVGESTSPTRSRLLGDIAKKFPNAKVYRYEPLNGEPQRRANQKLFGPGTIQTPRFQRANRILSLDCDFLGVDEVGGNAVSEFSRGRTLNAKKTRMNRLYTVEPAFTVTGGMADHRLRAHASQMPRIAVLFGQAIAEETGDAALQAAVEPLLKKVNPAVFNLPWIKECAKDLAKQKGKSVVVAGTRQPMEMHVLVGMINQALGAYEGGQKALIEVRDTREKAIPGIGALAKAMKAGEVKTLVTTSEADPVYDAPANLDFGKLYGDVETTIHLGLRVNATARASTWHLPAAHFLEGWGDIRSVRGVYSIVQPMILPLYDDCVTELEVYLKVLNPPAAAAEGGEAEEDPGPGIPINGMPAEENPGPAYAAVRETFAKLVKDGDVDEAWNHALRDGFLPKTGYTRVEAAIKATATDGLGDGKAFEQAFPWKDGMEVVFATDTKVYDGRYVNNGWLQEAPDPITKLTWDNAALMSVRTADDLGISENGDMITVDVGGTKVTVPALILPGQADHSLTISLGYGQEKAGSIGDGVGFNVYPLRRSGLGEYVATNVKVTASDERRHPLALTAEHYNMDGRAIVREGTMEMLEEKPEFAKTQGMDSHIPPTIPLYQGPDYQDADSPRSTNRPAYNKVRLVDPNHQWAMTIDLNTCTGCNACLVACQAENNIPIVGKDQVIKGREMHWIRMDRYFASPKEDLSFAAQYFSAAAREGLGEERGRPRVDDDEVSMLSQPVACMQCESAPCETVCPVNATVHTDDGLNAMVYNRCIGTRYCANNCPYKARRFNFFDYNKRPLDQLYRGPLAPATGRGTTSERLQKNPNVSVRMRGVIEKCTYCVQRIQTAKIAAKVKAGQKSKEVQVPTNAIKVACQQVCEAEAIEFGNMKNPEDTVNETKADPRSYDLLKYIGTLPRTSYLARIRNPNPAMPNASSVGKATADMH